MVDRFTKGMGIIRQSGSSASSCCTSDSTSAASQCPDSSSDDSTSNDFPSSPNAPLGTGKHLIKST